MITDLFKGASYLLKGLGLLRYPGLRRFVLIPLLVNVVIFGGGGWWAYTRLQTYLHNALPHWLEWLSWLLLPLFTVSALIITFFSFTLVANLIASPFNSMLAEKIEKRLAGEIPSPNTSLWAFAGDIVGTLGSEVRKLLYMAAWSVPLLILFVIPGLNIAAPFLWMLFGAWMLSLQYVDYPMGNHAMKFKEEKALLKQQRWLAWGFGGAMLMVTFIPVLNFFAMPAGVAGATLLWVERLRETREG